MKDTQFKIIFIQHYDKNNQHYTCYVCFKIAVDFQQITQFAWNEKRILFILFAKITKMCLGTRISIEHTCRSNTLLNHSEQKCDSSLADVRSQRFYPKIYLLWKYELYNYYIWAQLCVFAKIGTINGDFN